MRQRHRQLDESRFLGSVDRLAATTGVVQLNGPVALPEVIATLPAGVKFKSYDSSRRPRARQLAQLPQFRGVEDGKSGT